MKTSSSKLFLAGWAFVALVAFTAAPVVEAARGGGGGGAGAGAGRASGGGGGAAANRPAAGAQASNANADQRTNNVRNTSVNNVNVNNNNVNVNKNVNVNVQGNNGCCNNNGWDNDYHPVATAAVIGATAAVIGSMVQTVPPSCVPVSYGGMVYQQCGGTWYQAQGAQYIVVNPPY
jgi:hypothetical protein